MERPGLIEKVFKATTVFFVAMGGYGYMVSDESECLEQIMEGPDGNIIVCDIGGGRAMIMHEDGGEVETDKTQICNFGNLILEKNKATSYRIPKPYTHMTTEINPHNGSLIVYTEELPTDVRPGEC